VPEPRRRPGRRLRVQLVNAPPARIVERMYDTPDFVRLSLATLAAVLREDGHEVACVDAKFERLDHDAVLARVEDFAPDVVGLTAFTNEIEPAHEVARRVKARRPGVTTVVGGVHVSAIPERTLRELGAFDLAVVGEGERTLAELCAWIAAGVARADPSAIDGLAWRRGGDVVVNAPRAPIADQDTLPMPAWDLLPPAREYTVMTARGCPYRCPFCQNPNGRVVRKRSPELFLDEVEWLVETMAPERLFISDEIFTVDRARTDAILDGMIARGLAARVRWMAQTHVNFVDEALFARMKAAGCDLVGFGIETGDEHALASMGKGLLDHRRILAAREAARRAGLAVEGYFILGQPNETKESARATIALATALDLDLPIFGIMVPYPGTEVARMAERGEGGYRIRSTDWNDYNKQIGDALEFEHLSRRDLEWLQVTGYLSVFARNGRWLDLLRFCWRFRREGIAVMRKVVFGSAARAAG